MRGFIYTLALVGLMTLTIVSKAQAQSQSVSDVIRSQIDAFLADDVTTAFGFASPMIQGMFGTPERFGEMVRGGYPMVWRPDDVRFLDQREAGAARYQVVMIRDQGGAVHFLEYMMIRQGGEWRINGVRFLQPPGAGA
ncbi:hypothetical protein PSA7680_01661 [Pseudoruegeria aquimaris]|uniref:DUF4864 domain-containing protein n=1 Tax=Pseudoruegeria aquimaris TaxID=393663 RepID=A0A1Y5S964_9RHOB|nr:DUF4864 domain-containing protein [Pseudoruegeria aquimaris]SLN35032.1 hypothetical protein PSA7680_01661 [Pseudoruegeria aquimaris]